MLDEVPSDLDLVLHFAVAKSSNFDEAFASNAHGSADLMEVAASRSDRLSFFHCSSTAVYEPKHGESRKETVLLGDSHRPMPGMPTYSISKIAGEVLVKHTAKRLGVPTVVFNFMTLSGLDHREQQGSKFNWVLLHNSPFNARHARCLTKL